MLNLWRDLLAPTGTFFVANIVFLGFSDLSGSIKYDNRLENNNISVIVCNVMGLVRPSYSDRSRFCYIFYKLGEGFPAAAGVFLSRNGIHLIL